MHVFSEKGRICFDLLIDKFYGMHTQVGHFIRKFLRGIFVSCHMVSIGIEGMERNKVRVGNKTIKMHEGRGLLGRYLIARNRNQICCV